MSLAHAILVLLTDCPQSGYDLAKQFDGSVGFFWQASHQQIYRELGKLEAQQWVEVEAIAQAGRPDKKLYHVTELGKQQLINWMGQASDPSPTREALLVKMFSGNLVPRAVILQELERRRDLHAKQLAFYRSIEEQHFANPQALPIEAQFRYLTLRKGIGYEADWLAWCEEAMQLLS
ncbi:PadR family transcriptional regulator [Trichocoleus sp. FACHB-262]|uniref:PadR family transcriptional regulator n=1 Tax=Trichocoleus sp. FACHB-262 TaxID=2692869 RepID=UPI0016898A24|nr:PadR family transcriptional regulator [Trichocoleus sp. FACHB-262]MBD2119922.1 PadR family transcriptional regulator [Trichocoleus sp. FACHB-262]